MMSKTGGRRRYTLAEVRGSAHAIDGWWTRWFIDPVAIRLTWVFANLTRISPNTVTLMTVPLMFLSAYLFWWGTPTGLIFGAFVYELNFALDCVDGKLARLKKRASKLGAFADLYLDNINVGVNLVALVWGRLRPGGDVALIAAGTAFIVMHLLSSLMKYIARDILGSDFRKKFYDAADIKNNAGLPARMRYFFSRRGLNMVLFTTVEGEAMVFFFGPVTGYVLEAIVIATILVSFFFILKSILYFRSCIQADRQP